MWCRLVSDISLPSQILKNIEYILCDIDGTLTGINGRGHSPKLLDTIQRIISNGIKIGLVSGRETLTAIAVHRIFDLNGPIIGENGAELILDPRQNETTCIKIGGLSRPQIDTIKQRLAEHGLLDRLFIDDEKKYLLTLYPREFPRHNPQDLPVLCQRVIQALQAMRAEVEITYSSAAIDISARGVNKGIGIQKMCCALNVPLSAVAFVGDSPNDRSAFEVVGRGGGWLGMVGDDPVVKEELKGYLYVYYASQSASEGAAEFMEFFLKATDRYAFD